MKLNKMTSTRLCQLALNGKVDMVAYLNEYKMMERKQRWTEDMAIYTLIHSFNHYNDPSYVKNRNLKWNAKFGKDLINNTNFNSLKKLEAIKGAMKETHTIQDRLSSSILAKGVKELRFLSLEEVISELQNNTHAFIIYNSGAYDLTPKEGWDGVTKGLISEENMKHLLDKNIIERGTYFSHKGRRSYHLSDKNKEKVALPSWMKKLPTSYLQSCGVV